MMISAVWRRKVDLPAMLGPVKSQIFAAKELGNMGAGAKSALPALQALTNHADATLSAAAKQAIQSIKK